MGAPPLPPPVADAVRCALTGGYQAPKRAGLGIPCCSGSITRMPLLDGGGGGGGGAETKKL